MRAAMSSWIRKACIGRCACVKFAYTSFIWSFFFHMRRAGHGRQSLVVIRGMRICVMCDGCGVLWQVCSCFLARAVLIVLTLYYFFSLLRCRDSSCRAVVVLLLLDPWCLVASAGLEPSVVCSAMRRRSRKESRCARCIASGVAFARRGWCCLCACVAVVSVWSSAPPPVG